MKPDASVLEAARVMNEHHIGSLAVVDAQKQLVGIITERDVLTRVVAPERRPGETKVSEVMTHPVLCCGPETPLDEVRALMREKRIRHLPVVEEGSLVGMISIGDLNTAEAKVMTETIRYLERYMYNA
ncbi:MAG: CBS domain-containing protein [Planctomycetota bacterium]|nr:CBS domain-containing protein [Planctomycetota bacterium]